MSAKERQQQFEEAIRARPGTSPEVDDARHFVRFAGLCLTSGNVYGAIFRERGWQQTGEWRASEFPGNHGHKSPLWEWKP